MATKLSPQMSSAIFFAKKVFDRILGTKKHFSLCFLRNFKAQMCKSFASPFLFLYFWLFHLWSLDFAQ